MTKNQFEMLTDKIAKEILGPLKDNNVKLHYPFYANTFPLAYHYSLLLNNEKEFSDNIREFNWIQGNKYPSQTGENEFNLFDISNKLAEIKEEPNKEWKNPDKINLFFSTKNKKDLTFKKGEDLKKIKFTSYVQKYIFVDYSNLSVKFINKKEQSKDFKSFIQEIGITNFKQIIVNSDVPNEAKKYLKQIITDKEIIIRSGTDSDFTADNTPNVLKIYYYGAPTSSFFKSKKHKHRFKYLTIEKTEGTNTYLYLHYNKKMHSHCIADISNSLKKYFEDLFETVRTDEKGLVLDNVRRAYNKIASIKRHPSFFYNSKEFRDCLFEHHYFNKIKTQNTIDNSIEKSTSNGCSKKIIHFGLGSLTIGYVLPLLFPKGDSETEKEILIVQKKTKTWEKFFEKENIIIKTDFDCLTNYDELKVGDKVNYELSLKPSENIKFIENYNEVLSEMKSCDCISFSFGNIGAQKELLEFINDNNTEINAIVLPFENNLVTLDNYPESLVKLKIDRICNERLFIDNKVTVPNELYFEAVFNCTDRNYLFVNRLKELFDLNIKEREKTLIFCNSEKEFEFFSNRKKFLVNGIHFYLSLIAYHFLLKERKIDNWEKQYVTILQSAINETPQYKLRIKTFIKLLILKLIKEYGEVLKGYHKVYFNFTDNDDDFNYLYEELYSYSNIVRARFENSKDDVITRILKISVKEDSGLIEIPNTKKIEDKVISFYKEINDFYKTLFTENINPFFDNKLPNQIEINAFFKDYEQILTEVFMGVREKSTILIKQINKKTIKANNKLEPFLNTLNGIINKQENTYLFFDLDGTLFDTSTSFVPAIKDTLLHFHMSTTKEVDELITNEWIDVVGKPYSALEDKIKELPLKYSEFIKFLQDKESTYLQKGKLYPNVLETLKALKKSGFKMGICTNAREGYFDDILKNESHTELKDIFENDLILNPDKHFAAYEKIPKNKGEMLIKQKEKLLPYKIIMIGDRKSDKEGSEIARTDFIPIASDFSEIEIKELENVVPTNKFGNIIEKIKDILDKTEEAL